MILDQIIALSEERAAFWASDWPRDPLAVDRQREIEQVLLPAALPIADASDRAPTLIAYQAHLRQRRKAG